jgi:hypothetical protein
MGLMHYGMGAEYYLVMHYEYEMGLMHHLESWMRSTIQ